VPVTPTTTKDALQRLHRAYVEKLPQEVNAVAQQWLEAVTEAYFDQELLHKVHLAVHSLSGSAATYNLPRTSEAFARMEEILEHIAERGHPTPEERETTEALLATLKVMARAAVHHLPPLEEDTASDAAPVGRAGLLALYNEP